MNRVLALALLWPPLANAAKTETAIFSGGCFWCMESDMKAIPGVVSVAQRPMSSETTPAQRSAMVYPLQ